VIFWRGALAKHKGIIGTRSAGLEGVTRSRQTPGVSLCTARREGARRRRPPRLPSSPVTLLISWAGMAVRIPARRARNSGMPDTAGPASPYGGRTRPRQAEPTGEPTAIAWIAVASPHRAAISLTLGAQGSFGCLLPPDVRRQPMGLAAAQI
jgi:hypothetical protein